MNDSHCDDLLDVFNIDSLLYLLEPLIETAYKGQLDRLIMSDSEIGGTDGHPTFFLLRACSIIAASAFLRGSKTSW